jgi:hypothetical protein
VDVALAHGLGHDSIGRRYGLSPHSVQRHGRHHIPPQLKAAVQHALHPSAVDLDALKVSEGEGLLHSLVHQRARLAQHIELAVEVGDPGAAIRGEAAITGNLQLVSKLLGVLVNVSEHRHQHLLTHPQYLQLREVLLKALAPFPEARIAAGRALAGIEVQAAEDIVATAGKRVCKVATPTNGSDRDLLVIEHEAVPPTPPPTASGLEAVPPPELPSLPKPPY